MKHVCIFIYLLIVLLVQIAETTVNKPHLYEVSQFF
jgi:hypothetical protein